MRIPVHTQTEEVAGTQRNIAQPRAPHRPLPLDSPPLTDDIQPSFSALRTTSAPLESLRCYPLSPAPGSTQGLWENLHGDRGIHDDRQRTTVHHRHLAGLRIWLLDQLKFMARYKAVLYHAYGDKILIFVAILFVNLFGAASPSGAGSSSRTLAASSRTSTSNSTSAMQICRSQ